MTKYVKYNHKIRISFSNSMFFHLLPKTFTIIIILIRYSKLVKLSNVMWFQMLVIVCLKIIKQAK